MLAPLDQFGPYRVITFLGCGQLGDTYVAQDASQQQNIILKVLHPRWSRPPRLAKAMANRLTALKEMRPGVLPVLGHGVINQHHYVTQPYHTNGNLSHRIAYNVVFDQALTWVQQLLETLHELHGAGLVHYNLKPHNILFDRRDTPLVSDFGLHPALFPGKGFHAKTQDIFRAPEFESADNVDKRIDLYSLGAIWFNLLAGPPAIRHLPLNASLTDIIAAEPLSIQRRLQPFQQVLTRLLSAHPENRYNSCVEVMDALTEALTPKSQKRPQDVKQDVKKDHQAEGVPPAMQNITTKTVRCAACATCYRIPPDVLQKERLKLRCSQCGNVMVLPKATPPDSAPVSENTPDDRPSDTIPEKKATAQTDPTAPPSLPPEPDQDAGTQDQRRVFGSDLPQPIPMPVPEAAPVTPSQTGMIPTPISVHWHQIMQTAVPAGAVAPCHTEIELSPNDLRQTTGITIFEGIRRVLDLSVPKAASQAAGPPYRLAISHQGTHLDITFKDASGNAAHSRKIPLATWDETPWHLFYPSQIAPGELFMIQVYARMPDADHPLPSRSAQLPAPLTVTTARGTRINFEIVLPGFDVLSRRLSTHWEGKSTSVHFTVKPQLHLSAGHYRGHLLMSYDDVPYGLYALTITIAEQGQAHHQPPPATGNAIRLHQFFVIYDQADQHQALKRLQQLNLMGRPYFHWMAGGGPKTKPTRDYYRRLEGSDAAILFWSSQTEISRGLQKFCQYALKHLPRERLLAVFMGDESDVRLPSSIADWPVYRNILKPLP